MKALMDYQGRTVRLTDERLDHVKFIPRVVVVDVVIRFFRRKPNHLVVDR